jgi:hypothetical protein
MAWEPNYVLAADLADDLGISDLDQIEDDTPSIELAIAAASRAVDHACRRQFGVLDAPQARKYRAVKSDLYGGWFVYTDDLMTLDGLLVDGVAPATAPDVWPLRAGPLGRPWERMAVSCGGVHEIAAKWGWTAVPDTIEQATRIQAARFFKRRDAPFGVAGSPESGSEMRLLNKVDPDVDVMLARYKRTAAPR